MAKKIFILNQDRNDPLGNSKCWVVSLEIIHCVTSSLRGWNQFILLNRLPYLKKKLSFGENQPE